MDIIRQAFRLMEVVTGFAGRARKLYYAVMLMGHSCPMCGGKLLMVAEGLCRCQSCDHGFDPTVAFQKCSLCGGTPKLQLRRYQCGKCGCDITSRFLFDGLVFNSEYFREKMCESRKRKKERLEHVRKMLAQCRSSPVDMQCIDLSSVPGLEDALNNLTSQISETPRGVPKEGFDLKRYENHNRSPYWGLSDNPYRNTAPLRKSAKRPNLAFYRDHIPRPHGHYQNLAGRPDNYGDKKWH